jgi:hypothetical protein
MSREYSVVVLPFELFALEAAKHFIYMNVNLQRRLLSKINFIATGATPPTSLENEKITQVSSLTIDVQAALSISDYFNSFIIKDIRNSQ